MKFIKEFCCSSYDYYRDDYQSDDNGHSDDYCSNDDSSSDHKVITIILMIEYIYVTSDICFHIISLTYIIYIYR